MDESKSGEPSPSALSCNLKLATCNFLMQLADQRLDEFFVDERTFL
jgi:hypothetical protein